MPRHLIVVTPGRVCVDYLIFIQIFKPLRNFFVPLRQPRGLTACEFSRVDKHEYTIDGELQKKLHYGV